jgi:hypothetical protein
MHFLDANPCESHARDVLERAGVKYRPDDPVHRATDFCRGISIARRLLGFSYGDFDLLMRHRRPGFIAGISQIGAGLFPLSRKTIATNRLSLKEFRALRLHPTVVGLHGLLHEAKDARDKERITSVSEIITLNREASGWLRPYKLEENLNDYCGLSINEAARQLYRAVVDGRVRARYRGRILGPKWLKRISEGKWHPTDDYALPADIELSVEDAERIWNAA